MPLSYAGIALLAVLALGFVLLGTLRGYYRQQEVTYLSGNAAAIAEEIAPLLASGDSLTLQSQIAGFSFLSQARVEVLDETGQVTVADSGELGTFTPAIAVSPGENGLLDGLGVVEDEVTIIVEEQIETEEEEIFSQRVVTRTNRVPARGSLYGFNLGVGPTAADERSDLAVKVPVVDESGNVVGQVSLSQGPARGRDILRSVALGWAIAGAIAILLAALAGWLVSRRLTRPLLALTTTTGHMADGDLSARADVQRADELGILGHSFNRMADRVENTVNSLRQFTADAAHELHTPLTALQTDLQLLESGHDPAQQERLARAQIQAGRMQNLVDNLLELSKLESESVMGERPFINLNQLVRTTGELYASQAEQAGLVFEMQLPDQSILIPADESQLQRALVNVLDNSLKFTSAPGTIDLSLAAEQGMVVIVVRDDGIGIPAEDLPQLFGRFHRGRNAAGYAGSGLGLAIVQEIMAWHNGRVTIESGDWGTEVQLILPGGSLEE